MISQAGADPGPPPANFLVTNDAEFATANTTATAGQIIELQDSGTFTALTLTNATGVTVRGQTDRVPVVRSLYINGAQNATVTGLRVQANAVPSGQPKLVSMSGNCSGLTIDNCIVRGGNPWNSYADFDVTTTDTARMGTNGSWSATNPYTQDLWYGVGVGAGGAPSGSITIQNCLITDMQSGIKMSWLGSGTLKILNNEIGRMYEDFIAFGMPYTASAITGIEVCGNEGWDHFSQPQDNANPHGDFIQIFGDDNTAPYYLHPIINTLIAGNIYWYTPGARGQVQRIFASDFYPGYPFVAPVVVDNFMVSRISAKGITISAQDVAPGSGAVWGYFYRNTTVANPANNTPMQNEVFTNSTSGIGPSTAGAATYAVTSDPGYSSPLNYIANNITEAITGDAAHRLSGNITLGLGNTATSYGGSATPATSGAWNALTDADAYLTAFATVANSGKGAGLAGSTAATIRDTWASPSSRPWSSLPSWVDWYDLTGVTISSVQTSEWAYVHAGHPGVDSRAISITGGEYRIANDRAGTGATAWTSTAGTITSGKYLQVRQTASGSGSTVTTLTVTIGSQTADWSVTTASAFSRPVVSLEPTTPDLFRISGASTLGSDGQVGTVAIWGFKMNGNPGVEEAIFGASAGTARVRVSVLNTGKLRVRGYNAAAATIFTLDVTASVTDNVAHDIMISWNTNDTNSGTGCDVYIDGTSSKTVGSWPASPATISYSTSINAYQFGAPTGNAFEIAGFFLHTTARADFTSSSVRAAFTLDPAVMGLGGATPLGSQPIHFLVGTSGQSGGWNDAAGINRGSGAKFIKVGSAAAVDVSGSAWV
jgi:hypothetical protein